jgi:hypothetical protein
MDTRTYANRKPVTMELIESRRGKSMSKDGLHAYPVEPGKAITLSVRPGIRRRWRKN